MATQNNHPALERLRKTNASKVKVAVSDIDGVLRGKYLHIDKFMGAAEGGFGFCDVVLGWDMHDVTYDNTTFTGWHHGFPDALAASAASSSRRLTAAPRSNGKGNRSVTTRPKNKFTSVTVNGPPRP